MEDKIFNNNYGNVELETGDIKFELDPAIYAEVYQDLNDELDMKMMYDSFDEIIKGSDYEKYNMPDENGEFIKLNTEQINELFLFIIKCLRKKYTITELFIMTSEYFDISVLKFYNVLSNKTKSELIDELDQRYNIFNNKKYKKIF